MAIELFPQSNSADLNHEPLALRVLFPTIIMPPPPRLSGKAIAAIRARNKKGSNKAHPTNASTSTVQTEMHSSLPSMPNLTRVEDQETFTYQTPISRSSTANSIPKKYTSRIGALRKAAGSELKGHVSKFTDGWVESEFKSLIPDKKITSFLRKKRKNVLYDMKTKRWTVLDSIQAEKEQDAYPAIIAIASTIIEELGGASKRGKLSRSVIARDTQEMDHLEDFPNTHYTMPDVVFKASGPSFEFPPVIEGRKEKTLGYTNITSCIEIKMKLHSTPANDQALLEQVAVYARYAFPYIFLPVPRLSTSNEDRFSFSSPTGDSCAL